MALTPSQKVPLGQPAPDFSLPDGQGTLYSRDQIAGPNGLLVLFMCNHCPFVKHLNPALSKLAPLLEQQGIGMVGINANDVNEYPGDGPEAMVKAVEEKGYQFPYLYDETQDVAKAFGAVCTPDFFLHNDQLQLVYHGQYDNSRPGNGIKTTGKDLFEAVDAMLNKREPISPQKLSVGCNIKWK